MSILKSSSKGVLNRPETIIIYGEGGLGKDTWAAGAPKPYFLDVEGGTGKLNVTRSPRPKTYDEALSYLDAIRNDTHDFKTFVVSGLDTLQQLLISKIVGGDAKKGLNQAAGGFGNGPKVLMDEFAAFTARLSEIRDTRDMQIICIGHPIVSSFNDPTLATSYDNIELNLYADSKVSARELFFNWADNVFYVKKKAALVGETRRAMDLEIGRHYMYTQGRAAFKAKSRNSLPFELELEYAAFDKAMKHIKTAPELVTEILALSKELKEEATQTKIAEATKKYENSAHDLAGLLEQVKTLLTKA